MAGIIHMDNDLRIASAERIDARRRSPERCLYCDEPAVSKEHSLQNALGGRLWAKCLCKTHNENVNTGADDGFNKVFAPYMTMLQVARQDGVVGATVSAKNQDGTRVIVLPEGFVKQNGLEVLAQHRETRKITYARGDLDKLDKLPLGALSENGPTHVVATITNPEIEVEVDSSAGLSGALLKIALHFYHGFVGDVDREVAKELLRLILDGNAAANSHVRTPMFDEDVFADNETPRHEVTCYPYNAESCLVTILLFGAYAFTVRLPFPMPGTIGLRYRQMLDQRFPEFFEDIAIPPNLKWDRRPSTEAEAEEFARIAKARVLRLHARGAATAVRVMCKRAYERAHDESANYGGLWERYRAALQIEALSAEQIEAIVFIGRHRHADGLVVWEVPVHNIAEETDENETAACRL
jgi:hypothetical protein